MRVRPVVADAAVVVQAATPALAFRSQTSPGAAAFRQAVPDRPGRRLSRPGARGGWQLAEASQQVNLAQVWRAVQGEDQVLGLHGPNPDCTVGRRIQTELVAIDRRAARAIEDELKATTLSTLVRQTAAAKPSRA